MYLVNEERIYNVNEKNALNPLNLLTAISALTDHYVKLKFGFYLFDPKRQPKQIQLFFIRTRSKENTLQNKPYALSLYYITINLYGIGLQDSITFLEGKSVTAGNSQEC